MTFGYTSTPTEVAGTRCEGASCRVAARRVVHYVADGVEVAQKSLCRGHAPVVDREYTVGVAS